jgi:hypothetical protein
MGLASGSAKAVYWYASTVSHCIKVSSSVAIRRTSSHSAEVACFPPSAM